MRDADVRNDEQNRVPEQCHRSDSVSHTRSIDPPPERTICTQRELLRLGWQAAVWSKRLVWSAHQPFRLYPV